MARTMDIKPGEYDRGDDLMGEGREKEKQRVTYLLRWMMALKARPSFHELVKSLTRTPGYLAVVRCAHRRRASRAVSDSSCPTMISDICVITNKMNQLEYSE